MSLSLFLILTTFLVLQFLEEHPGGAEIMIEASGRDATEDFEDIGHSEEATNMLPKYKIGLLEVSEILAQG